ncbi:hypothetical protein FIBSPDRAFT_309095 [Athelia psychrophila]|uniref:Uncharacterized protein n=1 Tax=Athelia psychrophila TaxID=1759441 RepID=A0A166W9M2_9AGAM|nr:hypothetical protein FIBSPDRAFT_309095 [Fibularhizoctonia sp. CBS 109695]
MSTSQLNLAGVHGGLDSPGIHRRFFLGPMPEKVVSRTEAEVHRKKKKRLGWLQRANSAPGIDDDSTDNGSRLSAAIQAHAFEFFLRQGGREEDWEEEQESTRREMLKRFTESQWGNIWNRRRAQRQDQQSAPASNWVGETFEIGNFLNLGVNILDAAHIGGSRYSASTKRPSLASPFGSAISRNMQPLAGSSRTAESFVTARTDPIPSSQLLDVPFPLFGTASQHGSGAGMASDSPMPPSTSSTTALLNDNGAPASSSTPAVIPKRAILKSSATMPANPQGNGSDVSPAVLPVIDTHVAKTVHYTDSSGAESPVPPAEVLARTGIEVEATSAGATDAAAPRDIVYGDVVMRGISCFAFLDHR